MSSTPTVWEKADFEAKAIYPFSSEKEGYLTIIAGDTLQVYRQSQDWVWARNKNTFRCGICPKSFLKIHNAANFNLIDVEAYEVLKNQKLQDMLHPICDTTSDSCYMPANYATTITQYSKVLHFCKDNRTASELQELVRALSGLKKTIGLPTDIKRSENESILTTTELKPGDLIDVTSDSRTITFEQTLSVSLKFTLTLNSDARLCPRLYCIQNNARELLNAPADIFHKASEKAVEHEIRMDNLPVNILNTLLVELRVFSHVHFGGENNQQQGPWANEYIAVGTEYLGTQVNPKFCENPGLIITKPAIPMDEIGVSKIANFEMQLFMPKEIISPLNTLNDILTGHPDNYMLAPELNKVICDINVRKVQTEATSPDGKSVVHAIKESPAVTPSFQANNLFIHLHNLIHKTAKKRTRVILRVLDFMNKKFINCFERCEAFNNEMFATFVEKGSKEFKIDEMACINLDMIHPRYCAIIIEVQRTSRSKGTIHQSSYGVLMMTNTQDTAINVTNGVKSIYLRKPISDNSAEGLSKVIQEWLIKPEVVTETKISFEISLLSSKNIECDNEMSTGHQMAYILTWDESYAKEPEKAPSIISMLKSYNLIKKFLIPYIIRALAVSINIQELQENALQSLQFILQSIDAMNQRHPETYLFFQRFIDVYNEDQKLAGIHGALMKAIDENIPMINEQNPPSAKINQQASGPARCLPYYLQLSLLSIALSNEKKDNGMSNIFVDALRSLAEKISAMFSFPDANKTLITTIPFLASSYQLLCDLIWDHFPMQEATKLIAGMVLPVCRIKNAWTDQNRLKTVSIKALSNPQIHTKIIQCMIEAFQATEPHLFLFDTYPSLVGLLFSVLHFTDSPDDDILALQDFMEQILMLPESDEELSPSNFNATIDFYDQRLNDLLLSKQEIVTQDLNEKQQKDLDKIFKTKKLDTSSNVFFVLLLIYYGGAKVLEKSMHKRKDKAAFFWKILCVFRIILEDEALIDKPYYFFITLPALLSVLSFIKNPDFKFLFNYVAHLIDFINMFYKLFLKKSQKLNATDMALYQRTYVFKLNPLAEMLPMLLKQLPEDQRFIPSIFVPFFHFYILTADDGTRDEIAKGFRLIVEADYKQSLLHAKRGAEIETLENSGNAFMDALNSIANDQTVKERLLEIVKLIDSAAQGATQPAVIAFFQRSRSISIYMHDINTIASDPEHEHQKSQALIEILDGCLRANDIRLFVHFTSMLYDLHIQLEKNLTEAAETLVYTASKLSWSDTTLLPEGHEQEAQPAYERKASCLLLAIKHFKKSLFYESAIAVIQQLREFYTSISYDYVALAKLVDEEKELYDLINHGGEPIPLNHFIGVRFYGDFPSFYMNKAFVYRRDGFFNNGTMLNQMTNWFPGANVVSKPPENPKPEDKIIYIFNLIPVIDDAGVDLVLEPQSEFIVRTTTKVNRFRSEVPIRRKRSDGLGENAEGFIQTEEFTTDIPLQSYTKQTELHPVGEAQTLAPIEVAIRNLRQKSREILTTASRFYRDKFFYDKCDSNDLRCLTRLLNGIADAGVNGGIGVYLNLFFGYNDFAKEKINQDNLPTLKTAIIDQLKTLKWGSNLHHFLIDESSMALHMNIYAATMKMINLCKKVMGEFDVYEQPSFTKLHDLSWLGPSEDADFEEEEDKQN